MPNIISLVVAVALMACVSGLMIPNPRVLKTSTRTRSSLGMSSSYLEELANARGQERKCLVGLTTDSWNIGTRKYKSFLAVHGMAKKIAKANVACVEVPMWECSHGPHFDDLQRILESFWIPDMTSTEHLLLQFDLIVIPDPTLAKYMVEAFYEKEQKIEKKRTYYNKLIKQPFGVVEQYPPRERYDYERIKNLGKQKWIRKFPPIATCGDEAYNRMKNHGQIEYHSEGVEDFALHLPQSLVPSSRVLLLRYKNRYTNLVQSLVMKGINVTSAYPVTWNRKEWTPQEEKLAKECDVIYLHETHAVSEWVDRLGRRARECVAACHDEEVAQAAKDAGFEHIFFAKKSDTDGLTKTVLQAIEFFHSDEYPYQDAKKEPELGAAQ
jgi:uroporphyrinogen-III synthase